MITFFKMGNGSSWINSVGVSFGYSRGFKEYTLYLGFWFYGCKIVIWSKS